jgi:cytochrome b6-f complex iron-sulfur subunit
LESDAEETSGGGTPASPARSLAVDTPIAKPVPKKNVISRRLFLLGGFWSGLGLAAVALLGPALDFMWIKNLRGFGGPIPVTADRIPEPGADPTRIVEGKFYLVNLEAGATPNGEETSGGLLALYQKCPHLGCTVPYNASFDFQGRKGWFRCPCHNSSYTKEGGVLVAGPAPRSMDVFPIEVNDDRSLTVSTGRSFEGTGGPVNPTRTVSHEPGSTTPEASV